jgi:hypothetical protein
MIDDAIINPFSQLNFAKTSIGATIAFEKGFE